MCDDVILPRGKTLCILVDLVQFALDTSNVKKLLNYNESPGSLTLYHSSYFHNATVYFRAKETFQQAHNQ